MICYTCGKNMIILEENDGIKYNKCMYCGKIIKEQIV
jgi:DNA-directed RNA polymerase subunit RPC12/RpoP